MAVLYSILLKREPSNQCKLQPTFGLYLKKEQDNVAKYTRHYARPVINHLKQKIHSAIKDQTSTT
jgi:hypothetical protein